MAGLTQANLFANVNTAFSSNTYQSPVITLGPDGRILSIANGQGTVDYLIMDRGVF